MGRKRKTEIFSRPLLVSPTKREYGTEAKATGKESPQADE